MSDGRSFPPEYYPEEAEAIRKAMPRFRQTAALILGNTKRYRKVGLVRAHAMDEPGEIETPEGTMRYEAGDYICSDDPPTHFWPVKRDIFERTYVVAEDAP